MRERRSGRIINFSSGAALGSPGQPSYSAAKAGILAGDEITRLGDLVSPKWEDAELKILMSANEALPAVVLRDGKEYHVTLTPQAKGAEAIGNVGWLPYLPAVLDAITPGMPAEKSGLKAGDQIVAIDGKKLYLSNEFTKALQLTNGKPADLTIQRQGNTLHVQVTPVFSDIGDGAGKKWRIGAGFRSPMVVRQLPWDQALAESVDFNVNNSMLAFEVLGRILTRRMSPRALSGPVGITQMAGEAYRAGLPSLVTLAALISMQLAIFNILPIPVLDGGVILLLVIEAIIRHDLSLRVKERFVQVGLAILLLLVVVVTYFDIVKNLRPS